VKPLVIITVFNRARETLETLRALDATTDLNEIELVIVDNGSTDGARNAVLEWLRWRSGYKIRSLALDENVGCPRALNLALRFRKAGQPVVKLDNDVRILTPGWAGKIERMLTDRRSWDGREVAMVGAYYDGVLDGRCHGHDDEIMPTLYHVRPIIGHAVWHTGSFMDAVGYFDVLADDHLYGFEDLLLTHKAGIMGWDTLVWEGWRIENIQRHNALGRDQQDEHVKQMRPLYNARVDDLRRGGALLTGSDGRPVF